MNKKKVIIVVVATLALIFGIVVVFFNKNNQSDETNDNKNSIKETAGPVETEQPTDEPIEDVVTIDLDTTLTREFPLNYSIDYKHYINSAYSTVDGEISDKVTYNEIDTSQVGDYIVTFSVTDSLGNAESKELTFTIFEQINFGDDVPLPSEE